MRVELSTGCRDKRTNMGIKKRRQEMRRPSLTWASLSLLLLLGTTEAGKQRETEPPTISPRPTNLPTEPPSPLPTTRGPTTYPTFAPTLSPTTEPTVVPTTNEPTLTAMPTTTTKSPTIAPSTLEPSSESEDSLDSEDDRYTLEIPEMRLAFTMPSNTRLAPTLLQQDWQAFLTSVLQVAVGIEVDEWTEWDSDVTYTTASGNGVAQTDGQVAIHTETRRRKLNQQVTQETLEAELYDYFFVWGVDDMWEFFVVEGYPITSLSLQFSDTTFSPRRPAPEPLEAMVARGGNSENNKNAWIAGVVMAAVVVIVISVVALLYFQRQGRHTSKASEAASPRTMAVSDPASPDAGGPRDAVEPQGSFDRDMDLLVPNNMIVTRAPSEDVSSVPGFSESSFLYDASRLDQVIDSARDYELPYAVPTNTFSDLTNDIKDLTQNDEDEEEDNILEVPAGSDDDEKAALEPSSPATTDIDTAYSRSIFEDEMKETNSGN